MQENMGTTGRKMRSIILAGMLVIISAFGQNPPPSGPPQGNSSYIDSEGTAHVTRVVPVPTTVSPEAQKSLARQVSDAPSHETLEERRRKTDQWQSRAGAEFRSLYPVNIEAQMIAGVHTEVVTP